MSPPRTPAALIALALLGCHSVAPVDPVILSDDVWTAPQLLPVPAVLPGMRWADPDDPYAAITGERCNGRDDDGDGLIDEGYPDVDGDGVASCVDVETCDGQPNDDDDEVDEGYPDGDGDGLADCVDFERCDGDDDTRDGLIDEGWPDHDGDGDAECPPVWELGCVQPAAWWATHHALAAGDLYDPWPIPEATAQCGSSWLEVMQLRHRVIGWRTLARNVFAARLNHAEGAMLPPHAAAALARGQAILDHCGRDPLAAPDAIQAASVLYAWNNGFGGPPLCGTGGCGDGVLEHGEQCDDGNFDEYDGCLSSCEVSPCGPPPISDVDADGEPDCLDVETCDGLDNDGDGDVDEGMGDSDGDDVADCMDVEECDGLDNDGDGRVDDGWRDGDVDGIADCMDVEECDGVDNDGDSRVDEGFPDTDLDSVRDCIDVEECDGLDNDGDGQPDDGFPDTDTDGIADCVDAESCDGLDNDGDGTTDEGFPDADADGIADCVDVESCDGLDNDGDGATDEGFSDVDVDGTADCVDAETCDGVDNDGDGDADEGFPDVDADGTADCADVEECDGVDNDGDAQVDEGFPDHDGDGVASCVDVESCDGLDNDGDGVADEHYDDADDDGVADCVDVEACDGRDNDGDASIDEGFPDTDHDGFADCRDVEECDGLDNDGDGLIDEGSGDADADGVLDCFDHETCDGVDNTGEGIIDEGYGDSDQDGLADCVDVEECDGLDNDGDHVVDEHYDDGDGDGITDCVDAETCDGVDNNGDGHVDEGFDGDHDGVADCLEACGATLTLCSVDDGLTLLGDGRPAVPTWAGHASWTAMVSGATWLWDSWLEGTPEQGRRLSFTRSFSMPRMTGVSAYVRMAADNSYDVWLNDVMIGSDYSEFNYFAPADVWDASNEVLPGFNELRFDVRNWPQGDGTAYTNPGGLLFCLDVSYTWDHEVETCNGVDDDCDGVVDDGLPDADRDGLCDGRDVETCDGNDDDGDGLVDEGYPDADGDGRADCVDPERCNGLDDDGDGLIDEGTPDTDGDGTCDSRDGEECNGDDDDGDGLIDEDFADDDDDGTANCMETEISCNGVDDDLDGVIDEGSLTGTVYSWVYHGGHSTGGGEILVTSSTYDSGTGLLTFDTTIAHRSWPTRALTVAIDGGPNPKGHGELALLYLDATHSPPVVTVYAYNGMDLFNSYYDGSSAGGTQPPDRIATSLGDASFLRDVWAIDGGGQIRMGVTLDTHVINQRVPMYVAPWEWVGMRFGPLWGLWYHITAGTSTGYDAGGWLTGYSYIDQSWIDLENQPAAVAPYCTRL